MGNAQLFAPAAMHLPVPERSRVVLADQWELLAQSGTWWTGEQRIDIAHVGRAALRALDEPHANSIDDVVRDAAKIVATNAGSITQEMVEGFVADGLSLLHYVELVGIIARTTAIDSATVGLGNGLEPYLPAVPGMPTNAVSPAAKKRSAWVPTVGAAGATSALSAVSAEDRAQEQLHGALYLSYQEMGDWVINKGLSRPQMELMAARTSLLNNCYF